MSGMGKLKGILKAVAFTAYKPLAPLLRRLGFDDKAFYELMYWRMAKRREGTLGNRHYEAVYTTLAGLDKSFYDGKAVLDIGCGPRGSLEWLDNAKQRVGLDPLVEQYRALGIDQHRMEYVNAPSEKIPFPDEYFDVVTSINSLDHVEDLHQTLQEIKRILKRGGMFMLLVDIHPAPTIAEPITIDWSIVDALSSEFQALQVLNLEHDPQTRGSIAALRAKVPFNHADTSQRYGTLFAKLIKPSA